MLFYVYTVLFIVDFVLLTKKLKPNPVIFTIYTYFFYERVITRILFLFIFCYYHDS